MARRLILVLAALAASSCSRGTEESGDSRIERGAETNFVHAAKPSIGAFGVETSYIAETTRPGDDFYQHVNGGWLESFKIPDEFSSYGSFTVLFERSEARLKAIIEELGAAPAADHIERKISDFYRAYVDVAAIEARGLAALAGDFSRIDAANSHEDVAALFGAPDLVAAAPIRIFVDVDAKAPDRYAVYMTQSGLGMPSRDYYLEERFADKQAKYKAYVERLLTLSGADAPAARANGVYELEKRIAEFHWTPAKRRERDLTYNPKTREELRAASPTAPFDALLQSADIGHVETVIVREDDAVAKLGALIAEIPVETWRDYLKFHLINANAHVLPAAFDEANFEFHGVTLRGAQKQKERWKRAVAAINAALGEAVGKAYVERHFPASSKAQMEALVGNLRIALAARIDRLDWMSEATKARAREKLEKFSPKIGYPDKWRDYSGLEVAPDDAYGNSRRSAAFEWAHQISRLGKPVDKTEWGMTPQTVNAYYSPNRNEIVFPAAILEPPFFDPRADPAVNYGAIGAVIGHEIGHGFDDQGRKSDGEGFLRDWWSPADAERFKERAAALGAQYAAYEPIPGFPVDPDLTMGENIGDLGGLTMAYEAYRLSLNGADAPIIDGFTGDQRFFLAWAQIWKRVVRDEQLKNQIATDPHAPAQYRVNGVVRNIDAWYAAFAVTPEDDLYLAPEDRVSIW